MSVYRTILVPVDDGPLAERAVPWAADLAQLAGARLELALVHEPPVEWSVVTGLPVASPTVLDLERDEARRAEEASLLARLACAAAETHELRVDPVLLTGPVTAALVDYVADSAPDLVVLATNARRGFDRLWHGSVAEGLVHRLHRPVLVLPPTFMPAAERPTARLRRILVALDGSGESEAVLGPACELAALLQAELLLVTVPELLFEAQVGGGPDDAEAYLELLAGRLGAKGFRVSYEVIDRGDPTTGIVERARRHDVDMVALATRTGAVMRRLVGSVTDRVLLEAGCPVLTLQAHGLARAKVALVDERPALAVNFA